MTKCAICDHPAHDRRCPISITEDVPYHFNGLIFSIGDVVGQCACGLVDSLIADGVAVEGTPE
jgi:hypothetical protein